MQVNIVICQIIICEYLLWFVISNMMGKTMMGNTDSGDWKFMTFFYNSAEIWPLDIEYI